MLDRRHFLHSIGAGAIAHLAGRVSGAGWEFPRVQPAVGAGELNELAREIVKIPRAKALEVAEARLRQGLDWKDLEAAIFLAGLLEVEPRPPGFRLHAVLVVESVYQLAEQSPENERLLPVLFNLEDFKESQEGDAVRNNWTLPKRPDVTLTNREAGRAELVAALDAMDGERADRAVTALLTVAEWSDVIELLWARAIGDFGTLGHKVIFAAHAERTLRRIGASAIEPALRSLAYGLTHASTAEDRADFAESREIVKGLPPDWGKGAARPDASLTLARAFNAGTPAEARTKLFESLRAGVGAGTAWDAVRLAACEQFARSPSLLPVHPTTVANSLYYIHRTTREDLTRRVSLFQAASWIPRFRDALAGMGWIPREGNALDEFLGEVPVKTEPLDELLVKPNAKRVWAHLASGGSVDAFVASLRKNLYRAVNQDHQAKYAAAVIEDLAACHSKWRPVLLAPVLGYLPSTASEPTPLHARSLEVIKRVSVK